MPRSSHSARKVSPSTAKPPQPVWAQFGSTLPSLMRGRERQGRSGASALVAAAPLAQAINSRVAVRKIVLIEVSSDSARSRLRSVGTGAKYPLCNVQRGDVEARHPQRNDVQEIKHGL